MSIDDSIKTKADELGVNLSNEEMELIRAILDLNDDDRDIILRYIKERVSS